MLVHHLQRRRIKRSGTRVRAVAAVYLEDGHAHELRQQRRLQLPAVRPGPRHCQEAAALDRLTSILLYMYMS